MYVPDLKPICDLDLNTVLFEIKKFLQAHKKPLQVLCAPVKFEHLGGFLRACKGFLHACKDF